MEYDVKKYLTDINSAINEIEMSFENRPLRFDVFEQDRLRITAVERKTEIMREAINRVKKHDSSIEIPNAKEIINTRNRIVHGYDSVEPEFL